MALSRFVEWECRPDASPLNAGGFNAAASGINRSLSSEAAFVYTDLVIDGSDSSRVLSIARPFEEEDAGNLLRIASGTGFIVDIFQINGVDAGVAILHKSAGSGGSMGGSGRLGGALPSISQALTGAVSGNTIYVSGLFTLTATITGTVSPPHFAPVKIVGYSVHASGATRGVSGVATLLAGTSLPALLRLDKPNYMVRGLELGGQGLAQAGLEITAANAYAENVIASGCTEAGFRISGAGAVLRFCGTTGCSGSAASGGSFAIAADYVKLERCVAYANFHNGFGSTNSYPYYFSCIAAENRPSSNQNPAASGGCGFLHFNEGSPWMVNCTVYGNGGDGLRFFGRSAGESPLVQNCVFETNAGFGIRSITTDYRSNYHYAENFSRNSFFNNGLGNHSNVPAGSGEIYPTQSVLRDPLNGDFRLNNLATGGQLVKEHGFPGYLPALPSTSLSIWDGGAVQTSGVNLVSGIVILVEDGDGIPPAGIETYDHTPSFIWTASGAVLYYWTIYDVDDTFVASGSTLSTTATSPLLANNTYYIVVNAITSGDTIILPAAPFIVKSLVADLPIQAIEIPPFDIEPAVPEDELFIRYLPRWMAPWGTATEPPSGSLLHQVITKGFIRPTNALFTTTYDLVDSRNLVQIPIREPRLAWHLQSRYQPHETLTITTVASGASGSVRRSGSYFDFLTTDDAVFLLGNNGHLLFRNLARRTVTVSSIGTTGTLIYQYHIPYEGGGIVKDSDIFFTHGGTTWRIKAGSAGVDYDKAVLQLTTPFSGGITITYQSRTLVPVVTVSLSGEPYRFADRTDLWNTFDEIALFSNLTRRRDEDNRSFRDRILTRFVGLVGVNKRAVAQRLAQDLTLVNLLKWGGQQTLLLAASGIFGVREVNVGGLQDLGWNVLPEIGYQEFEELVPQGYQKFYSLKTGWLAGWQVYVEGIPVSPFLHPNISQSENFITFTQDVTGKVLASYRYRNYALTKSNSGFVTHVVPVTGNVLSGNYTVILTRNVRTFTAADDDFKEQFLLNSDKTANGYFYELRERVLDGSKVHFARTRWGREAHWYFEDEDRTQSDFLPVPLDVFIDNE
jgi:hypothetical protein